MSEDSILANNGSAFPILWSGFSDITDISFQFTSETFPSIPTCDQIFCDAFGKNEFIAIANDRTAFTDR